MHSRIYNKHLTSQFATLLVCDGVSIKTKAVLAGFSCPIIRRLVMKPPSLCLCLIQAAAQDHKRRHRWNHWSVMRVPPGLGQDPAAEPTDRAEWRADVQVYVRLLPTDVPCRGILRYVPRVGG